MGLLEKKANSFDKLVDNNLCCRTLTHRNLTDKSLALVLLSVDNVQMPRLTMIASLETSLNYNTEHKSMYNTNETPLRVS